MKRSILLLTVAIVVSGCASSHVIDAGAEAEVTYDGLVRVESSKVENFWAKPGAGLANYTKLLLVNPEFEFRGPGRAGSTAGGAQEFPLSEEDKQSLIQMVREVFLEELEQNRYFNFVEEPGIEVLSLEIRILDFVALVPRRNEPHDPADVYFTSAGKMTLVVEAHDSLSGEILVRAVERRAAQFASEGILSSRKNGWAEIRPVARQWAAMIRERLDQIHEADSYF